MKEIIQIIFVAIGLCAFFILFPQLTDAITHKDTHNCGMSKYNTYTNLSGGRYLLGKCYVPSCSTYISEQKCYNTGFLGLTKICHEEQNVKMYCDEVCFKYKTGEPC